MADKMMTLPTQAFYDPIDQYSYQIDRFGNPYGRPRTLGPGSSMSDIAEFLIYTERSRGAIDNQGLLGLCKALTAIVNKQNEKIEELEGMVFDHIEDGSDLRGDDS